MSYLTIRRDGSTAAVLAARSHIGGRAEQQDRAYVLEREGRLFAAVCDGMGGSASGGEASRRAVEALQALAEESLGMEPVSLLSRALVEADQAVALDEALRGSGSTLTALLLTDAGLHWASVGDSRLYLLRGGELVPATREHNYRLELDTLLRAGRISPALYQSQLPRSRALLSYLGLGGLTLYDLTRRPLAVRPGDVLLLTSDGLPGVLDAGTIRTLLARPLPLEERAEGLLQAVLAWNGRRRLDNTTFILIQL